MTLDEQLARRVIRIAEVHEDSYDRGNRCYKMSIDDAARQVAGENFEHTAESRLMSWLLQAAWDDALDHASAIIRGD